MQISKKKIKHVTANKLRWYIMLAKTGVVNGFNVTVNNMPVQTAIAKCGNWDINSLIPVGVIWFLETYSN